MRRQLHSQIAAVEHHKGNDYGRHRDAGQRTEAGEMPAGR